MLEVRTEPPLADDGQARVARFAAELGDLLGNPFGLLFGAPGLLANAVAEAAEGGADRVIVEVFPADATFDMLAAMADLRLARVLLQLRRPLPLPTTPASGAPLVVRPFRPGTDDEQAWLEVNNRAFSWHPDQRDWTLDDLHQRMAQPWFDPDGFLLHEIDGRLAGFCWTKVHHEEHPPAGEIFVIGVDPDFQGHGLGRPLTEAGLRWLAEQGLTHALLYTESDNLAALRIYQRLGFRVATTRRWYERPVGTRTVS